MLGSWVACLLPKKLLTNSSVGGDAADTGRSRAVPAPAFSGSGQRLGSTTSARDSRNAMRERAVQAALARERAQAAPAD